MIRLGSTQRVLPIAVFLGVLALAASLLALLAIRAGQPPVSPGEAGQGAKAGQADRDKDVEKLKDQIRMLEIHYTFGPAVEVQKEDYAQARSQFHTKLLQKGPSPQRWSPVKAPAGVTEIEYPSGDMRLKAWVSRPEDPTRKHPAVLYLHGGFAFGMADWDQCKPYRDAGFVVLTPILRAENGQPGAFSYFYDELDDVLAAAEYLAQQPYVDARRLFAAGHSVGGNLTLLAAMASKRFRGGRHLQRSRSGNCDQERLWLPLRQSRPSRNATPIGNGLRGQFQVSVAHLLWHGGDQYSLDEPAHRGAGEGAQPGCPSFANRG